ncbi:hypothetical protein NEAUS06_1411 [Nematocida ausubeli]|nr:hypothetical protein NEAUS06_1411 [Nematocida ausubeli]
MIRRILMNIMMMQSIFARVSVEDIKTVSETLHGKKQDVIINPAGPLNLLRGYIGQRNGYMHNKRFYSPEIDTNYSMEENKMGSQYRQDYTFIRKPVNDKFHSDLDTNSASGKYLSAYYTQLIKMFPSADGNLSIEGGTPNMITSFLRTEHVKKDTKYILAALLLLSEGVDIKIAVDHAGKKKKLVIKSKTCKEKEFMNVEMHMPGIDPFTKEYKEDICQSAVAEIVNFFLRCRDNPLLKKGGEFAMPTTKDEFESGEFLNNAAFLIQTYIYEFIDTAESYKDFVNAVHELLVDQVVENENPEQTKKKGKMGRIFDELFLSKDALGENIKYIESFCSLSMTIDKNMTFPFYNASQLPQYTRVPHCKLDKSGFEENQALYYSNCTEIVVLGIFCCLAYNPDTGKYQTSHMGAGISKELRDFFEKYPKPTETTNFEMHLDWSRVIACLKNDDIVYKDCKNELLMSIANVFLAIAEITGQSEDALEMNKCIKTIINTGRIEPNQKAYIQHKIEHILRSLSYNKSLRVKCYEMAIGKRSDEKVDLFADINIVYTVNHKDNGISARLRSRHSSLMLLPPSYPTSIYIEEEYNKIKSVYSGLNCYTAYIVNQYISVEAEKMKGNSLNIGYVLKENVERILSSGYNNISKVFLLGKLAESDCKPFIIMQFIAYSEDKDLSLNHPAIRFTSNILSSIALYDPDTRHQTITPFFFHSKWQKYYPKLGFKPEQYLPETEITLFNLFNVYEYILKQESASLAVKCLINYIIQPIGFKNRCHLLVESSMSKRIFNLILEKGSIAQFMQIRSTLEIHTNKEDTKAHNVVYIIWFINACTTSMPSSELISMIYGFIHSDYLFDRNNPNLIPYYGYLNTVLSVLEKEKDLLCIESDSKSVKKYNRVVRYFTLVGKKPSLYERVVNTVRDYIDWYWPFSG